MLRFFIEPLLMIAGFGAVVGIAAAWSYFNDKKEENK